MANAKRDDNYIPTLLAVSNADGVTPVVLYADPTTHRLLVSATNGTLDDLSDVVITSGAQGDILYNNGTNWVNLAAGTSGHFLKTQGAGANPVWAEATATNATTVTVANEATDATCFPLFVTAATGDLGPKSNAGLAFNSSTGVLTATGFSGPLTGNASTATTLQTARSIGGTSFNGSADITVATATGGFTVSGGNLALGTNSLTLTGSIGATGSRVTKGWFTDLEITNSPTVNGTSIASIYAPLASPTFTGTVTLPTGLTGVLRADSGVVSTDTDVTDLVSAASDSAAGKVELATAAETTTGTDTGRAVTPDGLAGSDYGKRVVGIQVVDSGTDTATGDGKAFFRVPSVMNGWNLVGVAACVYTAGTTNTTDIQIRNKTDAVDILSTKLTIDTGETDSSTAASAAVIDTTKDDVATGDVIAIDVDAVSTTAAKGLFVELTFQLP